MRVLLLILSVLSFLDCLAQKEISERRLIEDFDYAVQQLKLQHQGYYNYAEITDVDAEVAKLRNSINEPMTKLAFYQLIRELAALMNEGHGSVDLPKSTRLKTGLSKAFFPLAVKFLDGELIITQNFGEDVSALEKGMKIISINGESVRAIHEKLAPLIATDGFNETSIYAWMGGVSFSLLYRLVYGEL